MTFAQRSRRLALVAGLLLVTAAVAGPVLAATVPVSIVDTSFDPAGAVVQEGDTVTWTVTKSNNEPHTVTSGAAGAADAGDLFDSGLTDPERLKADGATFSYTFEHAGSYAYFCQVHPTMTGTVTVIAAGGAPGEHAEGIPIERRLIGAGVLGLTLIVLFGAAVVWRRMNPA
jgi:plastocyanin